MDLTGWTLIKRDQIEDDFEGFDDNAVFELSDGTFWFQSAYKYHYHYAYRPKVAIYQRAGRNIMVVEGLNDFAEVEKTMGATYTIVSDFKGWKGDTIFQMENGEVWKQSEYAYDYQYAYRPKATIVLVGGYHIMTVGGRSVKVVRIK